MSFNSNSFKKFLRDSAAIDTKNISVKTKYKSEHNGYVAIVTATINDESVSKEAVANHLSVYAESLGIFSSVHFDMYGNPRIHWNI